MNLILVLFLLSLPGLTVAQVIESEEAISASQRILMKKRQRTQELPTIRQGPRVQEQVEKDEDEKSEPRAAEDLDSMDETDDE